MEAAVREEDGENPKGFCGCGLDYKWAVKSGQTLRVQGKLIRRTLGDKTLKARFGVGEVATPLFDFLAAEEIV